MTARDKYNKNGTADYQALVVDEPQSLIPTVIERVMEIDKLRYDHVEHSGTFADKKGFEIVEPENGLTWTIDQAEQHCMEENYVSEPIYVYKIKSERWYVGGWCAAMA